ncbi:MAG: MarR family winged helix-turn-helix transcriptional regulator [Mangrovibacterium sp.]
MEELDPKSLLFSFVLKESIRSRKTLDNKFVKDNVNIKVDQFILLDLIYTNEGTTQQEIADELQKDKTIVLRQVKTLIEEGYVVRETDLIDARKKNLMLTESGKKLHAKARSSSVELSQDILKDVPYDQLEVMEILFKKIAEHTKVG